MGHGSYKSHSYDKSLGSMRVWSSSCVNYPFWCCPIRLTQNDLIGQWPTHAHDSYYIALSQNFHQFSTYYRLQLWIIMGYLSLGVMPHLLWRKPIMFFICSVCNAIILLFVAVHFWGRRIRGSLKCEAGVQPSCKTNGYVRILQARLF